MPNCSGKEGCGLWFAAEEDLLQHQKEFHKLKTWSCRHCKKEILISGKWRHERNCRQKNEGKKHKCMFCVGSTHEYTSAGLTSHVTEHHKGSIGRHEMKGGKSLNKDDEVVIGDALLSKMKAIGYPREVQWSTETCYYIVGKGRNMRITFHVLNPKSTTKLVQRESRQAQPKTASQEIYHVSHMVPANDCRYSHAAYDSTFTDVNLIKLHRNLNGTVLAAAEDLICKWGETWQTVSVFTVAEFASDNSEAVTSITKLVLLERPGETTKSAGFRFENKDLLDSYVWLHRNTPEEIMKATGLNFFQNVEYDVCWLLKNKSLHECKTTKCHKVFLSAAELRDHLSDHPGFMCDICKRKLQSADEMKEHKQFNHPVFRCPMCSYQTQRKSDLQRHLMTPAHALSKEKAALEVLKDAKRAEEILKKLQTSMTTLSHSRKSESSSKRKVGHPDVTNVPPQKIRMQETSEAASQVSAMDKLLAEKDRLLVEKDKLLEEKDKVLEEKDKLLVEKDKLLVEKDEVLEEKDKLLEKKDKLLEKKDKLLDEKNCIIAELRRKQTKANI